MEKVSISQARNQDNSAAGLSDTAQIKGSSNLNNATTKQCWEHLQAEAEIFTSKF